MISALRRAWPLLAALAVFGITVGVLLELSLQQNQGHLTYALDDPYIHMAIAKNLVRHGVWGITPYGFTPLNSSLVWPLLLSLVYALFGVNAGAPLVLNLLFGVLVLFLSFRLLQRWLTPWPTFLALLTIIFLAPLPALVFDGLEHMLQIALTLGVAALAARVLADEDPGQSRQAKLWLLLMLALLTATRFEGAFVAAAVAALFLLRPGIALLRRARSVVAAGACGLFPIAVFAVISLAHGWSWLPTSLLLKGRIPKTTSFGGAFLSMLLAFDQNQIAAPHVVALLLVALFLYVRALDRQRGPWEARQVITAIFALTAFLHMTFAGTGFFFRYEAYLLALGLVAVFAQLAGSFPPPVWAAIRDKGAIPKRLAATAIAVPVVVLLLVRAWWGLVLIPQATTNIYQQQYQMGRFVKQYYEGSAVAINDVGAVDFLADIHCVDLWGLATYEIARERLHHEYRTRDVAEFARGAGARLAMVYDGYLAEAGGPPPDWVPVGQWTILNNVIAGGDTVTIYAVDPAEQPALIQHLRDFSPLMPPSIIQRGKYMEWVKP